MPTQRTRQHSRSAELAAVNRRHRADAIAADTALTPAERVRRATALSQQAWRLRAAFAPVVAERYARRT